MTAYRRRQLAARADELAGQIEAAEAGVAEIEAVFANPAYYGETSPDEVRMLEEERAGLVDRVAALMAEWGGGGARARRGVNVPLPCEPTKGSELS